MTDTLPADPGSTADGDSTGQRVIVVGPDGQEIAAVDGIPDETADGGRELTDLVEQPAKVMRIGSMIKQLLDEVRSALLDAAARARLGHPRQVGPRTGRRPRPRTRRRTGSALVAPSPRGGPLRGRAPHRPSPARGWLEGLFHGIQTALFAQQMAARAQLEEMRRRTLGPGLELSQQPGPHPGPVPGAANPGQQPPSGPYL